MATITLYLSHESKATSVNVEHINKDALTPSERQIVTAWQQPGTTIRVVGYNGNVICSGNYADVVRQIKGRVALRRFSKQPNYIDPTPPVRG